MIDVIYPVAGNNSLLESRVHLVVGYLYKASSGPSFDIQRVHMMSKRVHAKYYPVSTPTRGSDCRPRPAISSHPFINTPEYLVWYQQKTAVTHKKNWNRCDPLNRRKTRFDPTKCQYVNFKTSTQILTIYALRICH